MLFENPVIHSIGTAVPPFRILQQRHAEILASANGMSATELKLLKRVYERSGIEYRYSVLEEFGKIYDDHNTIFHPVPGKAAVPVSRRMELFEQFAPALAADAVRNCLENTEAGAKNKITHLVTFSCTGMSAPGLDLMLADLLLLPNNIERTCINFMGCYAAVNAMKSAWHIVRSQPGATVLIAGVELCTLHYQRHNDNEHLVSNALFADGAAAAIISAGHFSGDVRYELKSFHSEFFKEGDAAMVWKIHENGFDLRLDAYVPALVQKGIAGMSQHAFSKLNITKEDIHHFALHPGGSKILQACSEALQLTPEDTTISFKVLNDYGNMSSVTLLFVLKALYENTRPGENIFACAFGPGLTMESVILTSH